MQGRFWGEQYYPPKGNARSTKLNAQRVARLRNWYIRATSDSTGGDVDDGDWATLPDFRAWPRFWQERALMKHRSNANRYGYMVFLIANGLRPDLAAILITVHDWRQARGFSHSGYDATAMRQGAQMVKQYDEGTLYRNHKVWVYRMGVIPISQEDR